jgi:uncharacterized protein YacL
VIPLIFALQQAVEGWIWLNQSSLATNMEAILTFIFPFIAYCFWTSWVAFAVRSCETDPLRRQILLGLLIIGLLVSSFFCFYLLKGPLEAIIINHSILYGFTFPWYATSQWLYGLAIIGATLTSSYKLINLFGIGLIISYNIAQIAFTPTYPSVFCFFSALISVIIYLQLRIGHRYTWLRT